MRAGASGQRETASLSGTACADASERETIGGWSVATALPRGLGAPGANESKAAALPTLSIYSSGRLGHTAGDRLNELVAQLRVELAEHVFGRHSGDRVALAQYHEVEVHVGRESFRCA